MSQIDQSQVETSTFSSENKQSTACRQTSKRVFSKQMPIGGLPFFGKMLKQQGFDKETVLLIMSAWRDSTKKIYSTYLNKWAVYCIQHSITILSPTLPQACKFLRCLASQSLGYGAVNTARCALSTSLPRFGCSSFGSPCRKIELGISRNFQLL